MMLEISDAALVDWIGISDVLGCPINETVETYLRYLNFDHTEPVMLVEDVLDKRLFYSRAEAETVAERFQRFCVERIPDTTVSKAVPFGKRWKVKTQFNGIDD